MKEMVHTVAVALGRDVELGTVVGSSVAVGTPGVCVGGRGVELGATAVLVLTVVLLGIAVFVGTPVGTSV